MLVLIDRFEYSLTRKGQGLIPTLKELARWSNQMKNRNGIA
ncbi:MAG: winged helix-turn-helix transcriptional regulator [Planifilum fimeticola]